MKNDVKCFFCKGDMENGTTTYMTDLGRVVIVIRGVPCLKCDQCGEVAYSGVVMRRLEQLVDELKESLKEVVIATYSGEAA